MSSRCPVHSILNQTFSVSEMAYLLREREALHICDSCFYHFQYRLAKEGAKLVTKITEKLQGDIRGKI